jgi:hypothetical protein
MKFEPTTWPDESSAGGLPYTRDGEDREVDTRSVLTLARVTSDVRGIGDVFGLLLSPEVPVMTTVGGMPGVGDVRVIVLVTLSPACSRRSTEACYM